MRHIAELCYPGKWLDHDDLDWCLRVESGFHHLERFLAEAAIALDLFESSLRQRERSSSARRRKWTMRREGDRTAEGSGAVADRQRGGRVQPAGRMPESYEHLVPYVHARAFMAAVEDIAAWLPALERLVQREEPASHSAGTGSWSVPALRSSGEATGTDDLDRAWRGDEQAVAEAAPRPGMLVLEQRELSWIAMRMAPDGRTEVEVSAESLRVARESVQRAIDALRWRGPGRTVRPVSSFQHSSRSR